MRRGCEGHLGEHAVKKDRAKADVSNLSPSTSSSPERGRRHTTHCSYAMPASGVTSQATSTFWPTSSPAADTILLLPSTVGPYVGALGSRILDALWGSSGVRVRVRGEVRSNALPAAGERAVSA